MLQQDIPETMTAARSKFSENFPLRLIESSIKPREMPSPQKAIDSSADLKTVAKPESPASQQDPTLGAEAGADEGVMTKKQVAEFLGVSENTIVNWNKMPGFPKEIRNGGNYLRWNRVQIKKWKDDHQAN